MPVLTGFRATGVSFWYAATACYCCEKLPTLGEKTSGAAFFSVTREF